MSQLAGLRALGLGKTRGSDTGIRQLHSLPSLKWLCWPSTNARPLDEPMIEWALPAADLQPISEHEHRHDVVVSVVMPCLNEVETLRRCIAKARRALDEHLLRGEIIVADNGSTDGSQQIAVLAEARVVSVAGKGYGNAVRAGTAAAFGLSLVAILRRR